MKAPIVTCLTLSLLTALAGCKGDETAPKGGGSDEVKTSTASSSATKPDKPSDGLTEMEGKLYSYRVRVPEGATLTKERANERIKGKTADGEINCYVNRSVSVYAQPKDMPQALREFATMGYSMKPSWQEESEGRFYAQLDKVKNAAVKQDATVHASIRGDGAISLRLSCYGMTADAELLRKVVKSFEPVAKAAKKE